jgi:UDP-N-acetylmuramoylalanine--D-glutamate ligase
MYPSERTAHAKGDYFYYGDVELCSIDNLQLPGQHNIDNACAAIVAAWPWVQDGGLIADGLRSFSGLPHRLKFVRNVQGVRYYDDSIATTPGSAIAAIKAFSDQKVLILGGSPKGADFAPLAEQIASGGVRKVILIGEEAKRINEALLGAGYTSIEILGEDVSMKDIVACARKNAKRRDIVILSPSCASFGMFSNYVDRGDQFIAAVEALK